MMSGIPSDKELVDRVMNGDTHAYFDIIKLSERMVAQVLFKMVKNADDRKDLTQDIYLKAYNNLKNFKYGAKLSTWITQIAYNTCLNYIEKQRVRGFKAEVSELDTEGKGMALINEADEIELGIENKQTREILKREIDKLPEVYGLLITLYHQEEMSYEEIYEITKLPEGTVKNYLYRARKMLKENILKTFKTEAI